MKTFCTGSCGARCGPACLDKHHHDVPEKWVRHRTVLQTLRAQLVEDRAERLNDAAEPLEPHSMNPADSATDAFDHDLALAFLSNDEHAIREIDDALQRIRDGTYGVCEETGKPIPASRLRAIPWTRWTRQVAEKLEREGLVRGLKLGLLRSVKKRGEMSFVGSLAEENAVGPVGSSRAKNLPDEEDPEIAPVPSSPRF